MAVKDYINSIFKKKDMSKLVNSNFNSASKFKLTISSSRKLLEISGSKVDEPCKWSAVAERLLRDGMNGYIYLFPC